MMTNEIKESDKIEDLLGSKARVKILKSLALNGELNISLIISKTNIVSCFLSCNRYSPREMYSCILPNQMFARHNTSIDLLKIHVPRQ